ncbi:MAG: anhydro-N-acetylmuramic acid kinase [Candidatus Sumerlaeaceae bacterium]|nr:anhydro-N-acetylmuramic acid kinase [Candidatus Sumerlaeaceae bacterium]
MEKESPMRLAGVMSGTSVDSIDVAVCDFSGGGAGRWQWRLVSFFEWPMPPVLRERILRLFDDGPGSLALACSLNFEIGEAFADAVWAAVSEAGLEMASLDAIASHGQTVYHIAPHMVSGDDPAWRRASTLQIGEPAVIAARTGVPVVSDFRVADMAAGGNGAPLVPFADYHLFSRPGETVIIHNLGGVANCTVLPASGRLEDIMAFDTGPGNMIMDALAEHFCPGQTFDRDGRLARQGRVIEPLLAEWMGISFIHLPPPKSTGRELFGRRFVRAALAAYPEACPEDLMATAAVFTARSTAENLALFVFDRWPANEILLAGGGAQNGFLVGLISDELRRLCGPAAAARVRRLDDTGFPSKARECVAFAALGYARLLGIPANVPSATGAQYRALLGHVTEPPPKSGF